MPPKAQAKLYGRFEPANRGRVRACLAMVTALIFGYITYTLVESARGYDHLYNKMQNSDFSNLSDLVVYLRMSSYGWAIVWGILGICFIARIMAGKDSNVYTKTIVTPILILAWVVTFAAAVAGGKVLWDKTEVRNKHELEALAKEKELHGTWQPDAAMAASNTPTAESYRDFRIIIHPGGSFTATGVPPGMFFNNSSHKAECSGTLRLTHRDSYDIDFNINRSSYRAVGSYGGSLEVVNGNFVIVLDSDESIRLVRTSTSTGGP